MYNAATGEPKLIGAHPCSHCTYCRILLEHKPVLLDNSSFWHQFNF